MEHYEIEPLMVEAFQYWGGAEFDEVTVVLQDVAPGCGRLLISYLSGAWTAHWCGVGESVSTREFLLVSDAGYIANKLWPLNQKRTQKGIKNLERLVITLKRALAKEACQS